MKDRIRINNQIRVRELRVVTDEGENLGLLSLEDALAMAKEKSVDLVEISPNARPPVAKIIDYGKFQYLEKKRQRGTKNSATETKTLQVKPGTGEHDLDLKAKKASGFLKDGHRVKIDLFLAGRSKYMHRDFLEERLARILRLISEEYKVADGPKKSPKGLTVVLEKR